MVKMHFLLALVSLQLSTLVWFLSMQIAHRKTTMICKCNSRDESKDISIYLYVFDESYQSSTVVYFAIILMSTKMTLWLTHPPFLGGGFSWLHGDQVCNTLTDATIVFVLCPILFSFHFFSTDTHTLKRCRGKSVVFRLISS